MEKKPSCSPCEQSFREEVNQIVGEVENYTEKDHEKKEKEVEEAFEQNQNRQE